MQEDNLNINISGLDSVLNDYVEWFTHVVRHISYPDIKQGQKPYSTPESFMIWMGEARKAGFKAELIDNLAMLHSDLDQQAKKVIGESQDSEKAPGFEDFDVFMTLFEEFIRFLRRIEVDYLSQDSSIDSLTGLRSESLLFEDLGCEMDRLSRQGKPFSLALVRIDNFEEMKKTGDVDDILKLVAEMIQRSLRSFDDAYCINEGEFILSLKQADISGGIKALERLKKELQFHETEQGKSIGLSLSSCVAEPMPGDNTHELVENLISDLNSCDKLDKGSILEYYEVSPLQRFVEGSQD